MLELSSITKHYGERRVLNEVAFAVPGGLMTGFVGGNGAGKTTTMRIIMGVLEPDAGSVTLNGTALDQQQRRRFGYMPEERGLYPKMRIREHLVYLARLHGLSAAAAARNSDALLEQLSLTERANDTIESLSLGNQQRVQIAAALVHDPELLILDEPFSGLDPMAVDTVVGVLRERARAGVPVLFSSHQLDIVERLCDHLVIIADGTVRAAGERDALRAQHTPNRYELRLGGDAGWLRGLPGVTVVELDGDYALLELDTSVAPDRLLRDALDRGTVESFGPYRPRLAEIFKEIVQ